MDDLQIDEIRQDVTESLKSAVRYSIHLDPRCFRWKMLSLCSWIVLCCLGEYVVWCCILQALI